MTPELREHAAAPRAGGWAVLLFVVGLVCGGAGGGCVAYEPTAQPRGNGVTPMPRATLASATRPISGNGAGELARLGDRPEELLRRGWILMETRRPVQAIHALNRVLYKKPTPAADVIGLAYYLRGRAFQYQGQKSRALEDCRRAREIAHRTDLRRRCDLEIARLAPPRSKVTRTAAGRESAGRTPVIPRRQWNAGRPVLRKLDPMHGVRKLTIHHSAVLSRNLSKRAVAMQIRSIQTYHIRENSWGDIGYHFLIDPAGRIWEGRNLRYQGAHAGGVNNEHNIGICLLGNFVHGRQGQQPSPRQVQSLKRFVAWLERRYSIPLGRVLTHREINPTTACPGPRLQTVVDRMRRHLAMTNRSSYTTALGGAR